MTNYYLYSTKKKLKEKLANIEHQRWADWQRWCHKVLRENCPSPELEKVLERWDKQIVTKYKDLSEKEKDSDRKQVDRYWPLIEKALQQQREEIAERMKEVSGNIRRFDDKEKGADYFAGWDNCLDTIEIDFKEFLSDLKGETK